jgi:hypothetical protein
MEILKDIITILTPIIACVVGVISLIAKYQIKILDDKIDASIKSIGKDLDCSNNQVESLRKDADKWVGAEKSARKSIKEYLDNKIKDVEEESKERDQNLSDSFSKGLQEERVFRMDILSRHDEQIKELFDRKVAKELCDDRYKNKG